MFKPLIAALAASPLIAGSAFAGPYVNLEANASYPDGEYTTATTDLHFGFEGGTEKVAYYVQGGPGFVHTDSTDDTETEISGKAGVSVAVADGASIYGEISGISDEDASGDDIVNFGGKLGVKYVF
jgi:outer membrane autotransporter protein